MSLAIKSLRLSVGLSQDELAKKMKVHQTAISQWERGTALPSCDKLPILAESLQCSIDALFDRLGDTAVT